MRIHVDAKLEKVVSKDASRAVLNHINIVAGDPACFDLECFGRAVATDGRRLVMVPVTLEEGDRPGVITPESLTMCRKLTGAMDKKTCARMLLRDKSVVADNTASFPRKSEMFIQHTDEGVHVEQVNLNADADEVEGKQFPPIETVEMLIPEREAAVGSVCLNPKLLLEVAEAMGSKEGVVLSFYDQSGAIRVDGGDECELDGAVGVLMPIRSDSEGHGGFSFLPGVTRAAKPVESSPPEEGDSEEMITQAHDFILEKNRASTSTLQRGLKIGYNRAARIMDVLEERGFIGPPNGQEPREILKGRLA